MRYGFWRLKRIAREITKEEMKKKKQKDRFQENEKQIYVIKKKKKKRKPKSDKHGEEAKQEVKLT